MAHTFGAVLSSLKSLKRACKEVRKVFKERDKYRAKCKQAYGGEKVWFTSSKKVVEEMHGLLAQSRGTILQLTKET